MSMKKYQLIADKSILHDEICKLKVVGEVIYPNGHRIDHDLRFGCFTILTESLEILERLTEPDKETPQEMQLQEMQVEEIVAKPELTVVSSGNGKGKQRISQETSV